MNNYEETKRLMEIIREKSKRSTKHRIRLTENEKEKDAIAITNNPRFGQNVLQNQIDGFRQAVNGSAKFSVANEDDPESNALIYYPKTGNVVFTGSIPSLNGLKFQMSLLDTNGNPYIFCPSGLPLNDEVITTLNKIYGFYKNFRDEWFSAGDMLEKLKQ